MLVTVCVYSWDIPFMQGEQSKIVISGGVSSFSFFAGLASDNLVILPTSDKEDWEENETGGVIFKSYTLINNSIYLQPDVN